QEGGDLADLASGERLSPGVRRVAGFGHERSADDDRPEQQDADQAAAQEAAQQVAADPAGPLQEAVEHDRERDEAGDLRVARESDVADGDRAQQHTAQRDEGIAGKPRRAPLLQEDQEKWRGDYQESAEIEEHDAERVPVNWDHRAHFENLIEPDRHDARIDVGHGTGEKQGIDTDHQQADDAGAEGSQERSADEAGRRRPAPFQGFRRPPEQQDRNGEDELRARDAVVA